ncbi:nucleoside transporter C-terminal domain-containing protein [uncultured Arthrobacter sp.]|uniref:nucleoside transporter C-terminal domain-containing protein n=1 Tax=uncultured Arthrobacter sp. TaxID=114050 RepID=UPI0025F92CA3|nr:nucleoside transporter C-terminal domain-containing protein [uncultured Arthrobacter sp.]
MRRHHGYVNLPLGAPDGGSFIGQKAILSEFVAYFTFGLRVGEFSEKTVAIVTFALAGFANFGTVAVLPTRPYAAGKAPPR